MNKGLFRLVFSQHLSMLVPASEAARSHVQQASGRRARSKRMAAMLMLAGVAGSVSSAYADQPAGLEIGSFVSINLPSAALPTPTAELNAALTNANQMTINQLQAAAIVNWNRFVLNNGQMLNIVDQAGWSMLHRIGGMDPAIINGMINAKGHQLFYNANGIIFGPNAQVNVGSLTATTLNIGNAAFLRGYRILDLATDPTFQRAADDTGDGFVLVEKGAELNAATGGRIMLLAENVENRGDITTPDGQTILAAGKKIYLADSSDPVGLLVEVDGAAGVATNIGEIVAARGNVSLVGMAVNQLGTINATTTVRANGSIRLVAAQKNTTDTGTVTLGADSKTVVKNDLDDPELSIASQAFTPSRIDMVGNKITINGQVLAKGGNVNVGTSGAGNRIYVDANAEIDVSGENETAPMSRNQITLQITSSDLRDTPILRNTPVRGQTVYIDARKGTGLFDIQALLDNVARSVGEKASAAGNVSLTATSGEVIVREGATIDLSGGSITYEPGFVKESVLLYNGTLTPISQANRTTPYQSVADEYTIKNVKFNQTRSWSVSGSPLGVYSEGYLEGADAGALTILGQDVVQEGTLLARTKTGINQRTSAPLGGLFTLQLSSLVNITDNPLKLLPEFNKDSQLSTAQQNETQIDTSLLRQGFNRINITANGTRINSAINTDANGSVTIAGGVTLNADITTSGGRSYSVTAGGITTNVVGGSISLTGGTVTLAEGVKISTSAGWTNDTPGLPVALNTPVAVNAGNITTDDQQLLVMGNNSLLEANAGAWQQADGSLSLGKAGNISTGTLTGDLQFTAYGFDRGGSFSVRTDHNVLIGGTDPLLATTLWLSPGFFEQGGFSSYSIATRNFGNIDIGDASGKATLIAPKMQTLQLQGGTNGRVTGSDMTDIASARLADASQRTPVSLNFSAFNSQTDFGNLNLLANTTIQTEAPINAAYKGNVTLEAGGILNVLGSVIAPSANINLLLSGDFSDQVIYDNRRAIYIGANSRLLATGQYTVTPNAQNDLQTATVLAGGSINVNATKGAVVAQAGSLMDVSGTSGLVDVNTVNGIQRQTVSGNAGSISISSRDALVLNGDLKGNATGTASAGQLIVALSGLEPIDPAASYPVGSREFTMTTDKQLFGNTLKAGDALDGIFGKAQLSTTQIKSGGFDRVAITSQLTRSSNAAQQDKIILQSDTTLAADTAVQLTTPQIQVQGNGVATVASAYVSLTSNYQTSALSNALALATENAAFTVNANMIDLNGKLAVTGVNQTNLNSQLDIRARGNTAGTTFTEPTGGWLAAPGELNLNARQIYPATDNVFRFDAVGSGSVINVTSSGAAPKAVLSAGGKLILNAADINQGGVLTAPLGELELNASNTLTLADNSLTSVSADGSLIPYGYTTFGGRNLLLSRTAAGLPITSAEKRINLNSPNIQTRPNSVLDISGGGDTVAFEWISGIGGTVDVLDQPGVYAVIPGMQGEYAAFDYFFQTQNTPGVGEAVYLSGIPGLAAGVYTLLPGKYALLPGAFMVQTNTSSLQQGSQLAQLDGSVLTSGYRTTVDGSGRDEAWSTFRITNGSVFTPAAGTISQAPAEYIVTSANQFIADTAIAAASAIPRIASDAGQLVLNASQSLVIEGALRTAKKAGARGALVDIVADDINVVSNTATPDGTLQVTAQSLMNLQAESLLLGGTRSQNASGFAITTLANSVNFANDAANTLAVSELFAAATGSVTLQQGASISSLPANTGTQAISTTTVSTSGDGALLATSSINDIQYSRTGVSVTPTTGVLDISNGSSVSAGRSLVLDATQQALLVGDINVATGGSATLGANRILLGDSGAEVGLQVDNSLLATLGQLSAVSLNSYRNVDIYRPVNFGNQLLNLSINAGGIVGHMGAGQTASLNANTFTFKNNLAAAFDTASITSNSSIDINANTIVLEGKTSGLTGAASDKEQIKLAGFDRVNLNATGDVRFAGAGELEVQANSMQVSSNRITGASRTDYAVTTSGSLDTVQAAPSATALSGQGLGAKLKLTASEMTLAGDIALASGKFTAQTTTGDLTVASTANISAASVPVAFDRVTAQTPGGTIVLQSDNADVNVLAGASVDVSGGSAADAGTIKVSAENGTANIAAGTLIGQAGVGQQAGSFVLDVNTLAGFSSLNSLLNSGNFKALRDMRIRVGNINIAGSDDVMAQNVVLSADAGNITVDGDISAQSAKGGDIRLNAGNTLTLNNGAVLNASATEAGAAGGVVKLASASGTLDLNSGSVINVSGGSGGAGGKVSLRTSRTGGGSGTGVAVDSLDTNIIGSASTVLEAVRVFNLNGTNTTMQTGNADTATSLGYGIVTTDVSDFMGNENSILAALNKSSDSTFHLRAGTEVRASGNLTVVSDWNLYSTTRTGGEPGVLTLRAANNLNVNGTINDGFTGATNTPTLTLGVGDSWSYRLVSGADSSAANVLATSTDDDALTDNFALANNKLIRTGTGDIEIASGGNITMGNVDSVIYTAGVAAGAVTGFVNAATGTSPPLYLTNGGDLSISAAGNIVGAVATGTSQQIINNWLFRQGGGTANRDVSWWVRPDLFKQGVAAFGGGDIAISAGGIVRNFSASIPTTGRFDNSSSNFSIDGGGQLTVNADGDIESGIYYVGRGNISLDAGGAIKAATGNMDTVIALQDASANVTATGNVTLESVFNPTLWAQVNANAFQGITEQTGFSSYFNTYGVNSGVNMSSLNGQVQLGFFNTTLTIPNITTRGTTLLAPFNNTSEEALKYYPGSLSATAFDGNMSIGDLILTPNATGNLTLLATNNIVATKIVMSDADVLPTIINPLAGVLGGATGLTSPRNIYRAISKLEIYPSIPIHAAVPVHQNDLNPVVIIARDGNISSQNNQGAAAAGATFDLDLPKLAYIRAGSDIRNLSANLQNIRNADTSVISAGRDLILVGSGEKIELAGPGNLLVKTGRNIDLGQSLGIKATANTTNSALSSTGASITLAVGLGAKGANVADYIAQYLAPGAPGPSPLLEELLDGRLITVAEKLATYRKTTARVVTTFMRETTGAATVIPDEPLPDASPEEKVRITDAIEKAVKQAYITDIPRILALDQDKQTILAYRHFSSELVASSLDSKNIPRSDFAIASMFGDGGYNGELSMFRSQVVTSRDGNIDVVAPGGPVTVGARGGSAGSANANGIVTEKGGAIRVFSESGLEVNQSKVITQFGSDIAVFVNNGDIDAGRGSRSAVSVPERVVSTNIYGFTTVEYKGVARGSGIQAQSYDPDGSSGPLKAPKEGTAYLIAPRGILNAGEAGIAAGTVYVDAPQVLNAGNITSTSGTTGVPVAATGSLAGSLGNVSNAAADATNAAVQNVTKQLAQSAVQDFMKKNFLPSVISVEVIGLGDL